MCDDVWRDTIKKDGTFVEGIKNSGEHLHYDSSGGSDVPVNQRNEVTGESIDLRKTPLDQLRDKGLIK
jgi:hypothetical protein